MSSTTVNDIPMSDLQCRVLFEELKKVEEYRSRIPKEDRKGFLKAVYKGGEGDVACFGCQKVCATSYGLFLHLEKCEKVSEDVPTTSDRHDEEAAQKLVELITTEFKVKTPPTALDGKGRPRKTDTEIATLEELKILPFRWLCINEKRRLSWTKNNIEKPYRCFGHDFNNTTAPVFQSFEKFYAHLQNCIQPGYFFFKNNIRGLQKLEKKLRHQLIRQAVKAHKEVECLGCDRTFTHPFNAIYHMERCQVEEMAKPWNCYRCKFSGTMEDKESHFLHCASALKRPPALERAEESDEEYDAEAQLNNLLEQAEELGGQLPSRKRTQFTSESVKFKIRKHEINYNTIHDIEMAGAYGSSVFEAYRIYEENAKENGICKLLAAIQPATWQRNEVDQGSRLYEFLNRTSVTIRSVTPMKGEITLEKIPPGQRVKCFNSTVIYKEDSGDEPLTNLPFQTPTSAAVAFCGGPIASVKVAPNLMADGAEVVATVAFIDEDSLTSEDGSVVHFWRHSRTKDESALTSWFTMYIKDHGTVSHAEWLLVPKGDDQKDLIGFLALATTHGKVLIYRIDETTVSREHNRVDETVYVVEPEPDVILTRPMIANDALDDTTTSYVEDAESPCITSMSWSSANGGRDLVVTVADGALLYWDLDDDPLIPSVLLEEEWMSPAWDVKFFNANQVAVAFREKLIRIIDIRSLATVSKILAPRTTGTAVYTDQRFLKGLFGYQIDHTAIANFGTITGVSYMSQTSSHQVLSIPTYNDHQLMIFGVTVCPRNGAIVSCGADGKVVASVNGHVPMGLLAKGIAGQLSQTPIHLARRKLGVVDRSESVAELLAPKKGKKVKQEEGVEPAAVIPEPEEKPTAEMEKPLIEHEDVCAGMWLDVDFESLPRDKREPMPLCLLDRRIEALTAVDVSAAAERPAIFTGGEAGLLFAVDCSF